MAKNEAKAITKTPFRHRTISAVSLNLGCPKVVCLEARAKERNCLEKLSIVHMHGRAEHAQVGGWKRVHGQVHYRVMCEAHFPRLLE